MSESAKVPATEIKTIVSNSDSNLCWKNVIKINLEARQQASSEGATSNSLSTSTSVGLNSVFAGAQRSDKPLSEVIVVSDEDHTPNPDNCNLTMESSKNTTASRTNSPSIQDLQKLLQEEENKLMYLKTVRGLQEDTGKPSIQGSALNKTSGRSAGSGSGRNSPSLRGQAKHSIMVVPGNQSSRPTVSNSLNNMSPRLQSLVDNMASAGGTERVQPNASKAAAGTNKIVSVTTPPVPGLTSAGSSLQNSSYKAIAEKQLGVPKLKPKSIATTISHTNRLPHEIITITDSPMGKKPPPLLSSSSASKVSAGNGSAVSTISSSGLLGNMSSATVADKKNYLVAEQSRRYREYLLKQTHAKKNFQKQIERKMVVASYPKTFRQVWPLIPVHDSSFVRNFGLESVMHHFDPESKALQEKSNSKVKPICNQCSCDFASAWQIRKSNSKQLLLCESCDFQNLKILQRSKLSNQLKELLDSIKTEQVKFANECELARKQMLELEKQTTLTAAPPPLTSQLPGQLVPTTSAIKNHQVVISTAQKITGTTVGISSIQKGNPISQAGKAVQNSTIISKSASNKILGVPAGQPKKQTQVIANSGASQQQTVVIPSVLGQRSTELSVADIGTKRPAPAERAAAPPSKVWKPGSALDMTLTRLSKQLIKRKLDENRQECPTDEEEEEEGEGVVVVIGDGTVETASNNAVTSPTLTPASQRTKNRRKGTPNKRLVSTSSVNSE